MAGGARRGRGHAATPPDDAEATEPEETGPSAEELEAAAHADSARAAQERADADVASGDYAAAAQERETAENDAWAATDSSMLHGASSIELDSAAAHHEEAERLEQEEARHVQDGDYAAAREDASRAADAQGWSDYRAGGEDHTGQARAEVDKEDWAVWHEQQSGEAERNAEWYAAHGDADAAESSMQSAAEHQAHGRRVRPGGRARGGGRRLRSVVGDGPRHAGRW